MKRPLVRRLSGLIALACIVLLLPLAASASEGGWVEGEVFLPAGGSQVASLPAVACASAASCTAVGGYVYTEDLHTRALVVQETAGTWQLQGMEAPTPNDAVAGGSAALSSVACVSAGNCTAVGAYANASGTPPLLVTESAGKWSAASPPANPGVGAWPYVGDPGPASVACAQAGHCVAAFGVVLLVEAGGTWSALLPPLPAGAWAGQDSPLFSVACPSVGHCIAVGTYTDVTGEPIGEGLIETESNGSWTASKALLPPDAVTSGGTGAFINNVVCPSADNCTAIGMYESPQGNAQGERGLLLTESNGVWSATPAPLPSDAGTNNQLRLSSLACFSVGNCSVVGTYDDNSSTRHWLVLTETNGAWTSAEPQLPSSLALGPLTSVTCPTADTCLASGNVHESSQVPQGVVLIWSGSGADRQWSAVETTLPSDAAGANLNAITCADDTHCSAVGSFEDGAQTNQGLIVSEGSKPLPPLPTVQAGGRPSAKLTHGAVWVFPGITISCPVATGSPCPVVASVAKKHVSVGRIGMTVRATGKHQALSFKLNRAGVRLLRRARSLTLTLKGLTGIEGDSATVAFNKKFTTKAPRGLRR